MCTVFLSLFFFVIFQPSVDQLYLWVWIRVGILVNTKGLFTPEVNPEVFFSTLDSSCFNPIFTTRSYVVGDSPGTNLVEREFFAEYRATEAGSLELAKCKMGEIIVRPSLVLTVGVN